MLPCARIARRRRRRRLIVEVLEGRALLAHCGPFDLGDGLGPKFIGDGITTFTEDFSDNPNHEDPATVGGAVDACEAQGERHFTHDPSQPFLARGNMFDLPPFNPTYALALLRGGAHEIQFRGIHPDFEVAAVGVDVLSDGFGPVRVEFVGAQGTIVIEGTGGGFAGHHVATRGSIIPGTQTELGSIQSIRFVNIGAMAAIFDNVTLLVAPREVNDPPLARDDRATTRRETPLLIDVLNNDFDADGDPLTLSLPATTTLRGGQVEAFGQQVLYTPPAGFPAAADQTVESRTDRFTYAVSDDHGHTVTENVEVFVNTPPTVPGTFLIRPREVASFAGVLNEGADADGDPLTLELVSGPQRGELLLDVVSRRFEYFPDDPSDPLDDVFTYLVRDSFGAASNVAEARIAVANQAPLASGFFRVAPHGQDVPLEGSLGSDPDGDALRIELVPFDHDGDPQTPDVTGPQHGRLTFFPDGRFVYDQLAPDYIHWGSGREILNDRRLRGSDRFVYRLRDHAATSDPATMELVVANQPPETEFWRNGLQVIQADAFVLPPESITVSAPGVLWDDVDFDGDPLSAVLVDGPDHGALVLRPDGSFTYVPQPGFTGQDGFRYRASDGFLASPITQVSLLISADAPIVNGEFYFPMLADFDRNLDRHFVSTPDRVIDNDHWSNGEVDAFRVFGGLGLSAATDGGLVDLPNVDFIERELRHLDSAGRFVFEECFVGTRRFSYALLAFADSLSSYYLSNIAPVTIRSQDADTDGDGVLDSDEGVCESTFSFAHRSAHVASLPNAVDGRRVSLSTFDPSTPLDATLAEVAAVANPAAEPPPAGVSFPLGFFQFEVQELPLGSPAVVRLELPEGVVVNTYWKFGREPTDDPATPLDERMTEHWYEFLFDGATGAEFEEPSGGVQRIRIHLLDGGRGDDDLTANGLIVDPGGPGMSAAPRVTEVVINDGGVQRSKINSVTVHFDGLVTIEQGAFEVQRIGARQPAKLSVEFSESDGHTVAMLTFRGRAVIGGSLPDGQFTLTIRADKIRGTGGRLLDGDGDGIGGGNYVDEFFRRFGDADGDGDVDQDDKQTLLGAFGQRRGSGGYLWYLDYNNNGRIWAEDLALLLRNFSAKGKRR